MLDTVRLQRAYVSSGEDLARATLGPFGEMINSARSARFFLSFVSAVAIDDLDVV